MQGAVQIFSTLIIREHHICFCKSPVLAVFSVDRSESIGSPDPQPLSYSTVYISISLSMMRRDGGGGVLQHTLPLLVVLAFCSDSHLKGVGGSVLSIHDSFLHRTVLFVVRRCSCVHIFFLLQLLIKSWHVVAWGGCVSRCLE